MRPPLRTGDMQMHRRTSRINWVQECCGIARFAASSLTAFTVDYALYSLLVFLTKGLGGYSLLASNIFARIVSSALNYWINKHLVFHSRERALTAGSKYFTLALCILAGNTALLYLLTRVLPLNKYAAKLLVEMIFFLVSWHVQKVFIFKASAAGSRASAQKPKG